MSEPVPASTPCLVIVLNAASPATLAVALRYAVTAAAMDMAVELHAVGSAVAMLRHDALDAAALAQLRQATALGAFLYACPAALADHGVAAGQLIADVAGVRGAASLLAGGFAPGARFLVF
jgi:predicted peroxiredoxin